jgi:hypothetical protein
VSIFFEVQITKPKRFRSRRKMQPGSIKEILERHSEMLMALPGVTGIGEGIYKDAPCIKVFVSRLSDKFRQEIPEHLEGYPVIPVETGRFRPLT